jgi:hypothetical protein
MVCSCVCTEPSPSSSPPLPSPLDLIPPTSPSSSHHFPFPPLPLSPFLATLPSSPLPSLAPSLPTHLPILSVPLLSSTPQPFPSLSSALSNYLLSQQMSRLGLLNLPTVLWRERLCLCVSDSPWVPWSVASISLSLLPIVSNFN